ALWISHRGLRARSPLARIASALAIVARGPRSARLHRRRQPVFQSPRPAAGRVAGDPGRNRTPRDAMRIKVLLSWSSGKDSAWSLHTLRSDPRYDVVGLLTTINAAADRVAMHAV